MFDLDNILHFAELNIQTIGIFIAIIGGLLVTKLLNLKIEKSELVDKLNILNKEIDYNSDRIKTRKERIFKNNNHNRKRKKKVWIHSCWRKIRKIIGGV